MSYNTLLRINKSSAIAIFCIIMMLIFAFYIHSILNSPPEGIADGVYKNECCADIIIKEPKITHGGDAFKIKILNMKFGLSGIVAGDFTTNGIQKSDKYTWLEFSKEGGRRVLTLPIGNNSYRFMKVEATTSSK